MSAATLPRSRPCTLAYTSKTGWMLVWLEFVATFSRLNVATLLSMPGTVWPLIASEVETGVFASAFSELTLYSGVCTAR